jgi:hypothetical protein
MLCANQTVPRGVLPEHIPARQLAWLIEHKLIYKRNDRYFANVAGRKALDNYLRRD